MRGGARLSDTNQAAVSLDTRWDTGSCGGYIVIQEEWGPVTACMDLC